MKAIPIRPRGRIFDAAAQQRVIDNVLNGAALAAQSDFETTTQTWEHDVSFHISTEPNARTVATDSLLYHWVNDGTGAHQIPAISPRTKQAITITSGGRPKTRVGRIGSSAGSRGKVVAIRKRTNPIIHPGTAPRLFARKIAETWEQQLPKLMQRAIAAEARRR